MLYIQASNIHQGGGAILLQELLQELESQKIKTHVFIDVRFKIDIEKFQSISFSEIQPNLISRLQVEIKLHQLAKKAPEAKFLFFGNLPPLFPSSKNTFLFFQNVILLDPSQYSFSLKTKIKHIIEFFWIQYGLQYIQKVFVQTPSAQRSFLAVFPNSNVQVFPFIKSSDYAKSPSTQSRNFFLYVASGDPHKNHINLLKAWILIHELGIKEKLILTTDQFNSATHSVYQEALKKGVQIEIKSDLTHKQVLDLYPHAIALIFPSLTESFGLPLIEAQICNTPIIAAELDYVRDIVNPRETFDPNSPTSISRAIQRFLSTPISCQKISSSKEFLAKIVK